MFHRINSLIRLFVGYFEEIVIALVLSFLFLTVIANVLIRWLPIQIIWTEELAKYLFVWTIFMGVSSAVKYNDHVSVTFFVDSLPERLRSFAVLLSDMLFLGFSVFITYQGWMMFHLHLSIGKSIDSVRFPIAVFSVVMPLAFGCTTIRQTQKVLRDLGVIKKDLKTDRM